MIAACSPEGFTFQGFVFHSKAPVNVDAKFSAEKSIMLAWHDHAWQQGWCWLLLGLYIRQFYVSQKSKPHTNHVFNTSKTTTFSPKLFSFFTRQLWTNKHDFLIAFSEMAAFQFSSPRHKLWWRDLWCGKFCNHFHINMMLFFNTELVDWGILSEGVSDYNFRWFIYIFNSFSEITMFEQKHNHSHL